MKDVGHLVVKIVKAQGRITKCHLRLMMGDISGLHSADLGGKSDPFAVVEVVNDRVQTQTEYKTLAPVWQKIFCL